MRYQDFLIPSALLGNAFAQTTSLSLQNNRVKQADCAPKLRLCFNTKWKNCYAPITSSNRCVSTDRLNDAASIAIDLGLCCTFYADSNCITTYVGGGWYPGYTEIGDAFKAQVGSYMCNNGTESSICPRGGAGRTSVSGSTAISGSTAVSGSTATPTASQYLV